MATPITINVTNNSTAVQNFFFFQQPAQFSAGTVYANSLYTAPLLPFTGSGATITFTPTLQVYAGVQQQVQPPQVGQVSGFSAARQPIGVAPGAPNTTTMTVSPSLGLSVPVSSTPGPAAGSFRILVPTFNPALGNYNAGLAVQSITGQTILSSFVTAQPTGNLDCQPAAVFYVAIGSYAAGTVIDFTQASTNAGKCDTTPGSTTFNVTYNANGTFAVQPFAMALMADGRRMLVAKSF